MYDSVHHTTTAPNDVSSATIMDMHEYTFIHAGSSTAICYVVVLLLFVLLLLCVLLYLLRNGTLYIVARYYCFVLQFNTQCACGSSF
jgi:hypothetical protein